MQRKFLDTTVYYTKNKTLKCREIMKQDKLITLSLQFDNYCFQILLRDITILIIDHHL